MSLTTVTLTPRMTFVSLVMVTVSRCVWPSLIPEYTRVRPTGNGKYRLLTTATKLFESNVGPLVAGVAPAAEPHKVAISVTASAAPVDPVNSFLNICFLLRFRKGAAGTMRAR